MTIISPRFSGGSEQFTVLAAIFQGALWAEAARRVHCDGFGAVEHSRTGQVPRAGSHFKQGITGTGRSVLYLIEFWGQENEYHRINGKNLVENLFHIL